jgi:hypothetical protein
MHEAHFISCAAILPSRNGAEGSNLYIRNTVQGIDLFIVYMGGGAWLGNDANFKDDSCAWQPMLKIRSRECHRAHQNKMAALTEDNSVVSGDDFDEV